MLNWWPSWRFRGFGSRPRLRVFREEEESQPVPVGAPAAPRVDEHLEAELDAILEKLSRTGREGLTEQEREILKRASEVYKRKRT
jgi:hypothetical protein